MSGLKELKNSSYINKHIVDAEDLMYNFKLIQETSGSVAFQNLIEATGQTFNLLDTEQLVKAIVQLVVASNFFKDTGSVNTIVLAPYTDSYGAPIEYIRNMSLNFIPAFTNTGNTTIAIPNNSAKRLLNEFGAELSAGAIEAGTVYNAVYNGTDFILKPTKSDTTAALSYIINAITSAGLSYSSASLQQLAQAIALYAVQHTYENYILGTDKELNNYRLKPYGNFKEVPLLTDGLVIRFKPIFANTLNNVTVQVGNLPKVSLFDATGNLLNAGDLSVDADVIIKYNSGKFYLTSNKLSTLSLQNEVQVNSISNDPSLVNNSSTSLVTENAVKQYVDARDISTKGYVVASGTEGFLQSIPNGVRVLAGNGADNPYYNMVVSSTDADASVSRAGYAIDNCFDGDNSTFYETEAQGSDVQGEGEMGQAGMVYTVDPCYIGYSNLTAPVKRVRLLCNKTSTMPTQVFFRYSVNGADWQNVGEIVEVSTGGAISLAVKPTIYNVFSTEGTFTDIDIEFTPYNNATDPTSGIAAQYDFRCYAYTFPEQQPDEEDYIHGWQVVEYQFCYKGSQVLQPLVLSYDDQTPEIISDFTDIDMTTETEGTPDYPDGTYVILKYFGNGYELVPSDHYIESSATPVVSGSLDTLDLYRWVYIKDNTITSRVYNTVDLDTDSSVIILGTNTLTIPNSTSVQFSGLPKDGDSFTIEGVDYTFKTTVEEPYDVLIGSSVSETANNLKQAINLENDGTGIYGVGTAKNLDVSASVSSTTITLATISQNPWVDVKYVKLGEITKDSNALELISTVCVPFNATFNETGITLDSTTPYPKSILHGIGSLSRAKVFLRRISTGDTTDGFVEGDTIELTNQATIVAYSTEAQSVSVGDTSLTIADIEIGGATYTTSVTPNPHAHLASFTYRQPTVKYTTLSCGKNNLVIYSNGITVGGPNGIVEINPSNWVLDVICERAF